MDTIDRYKRGYIRVDLDAIINNMKNMKAHVSSSTKMIGVIKTDGYGHGSIPIAKALDRYDFMYGFAVATEEEALELVDAGIKRPVLVLGYTFPYAYEAMALKGIETTVFRYDMVEEMAQAARKADRVMRVHVKVDTGMGRIGIMPDDTGVAFVKKVMETDGVEIAGVFSHFARSDEKDKSHALEQLSRFHSFMERLEKELGLDGVIRHCSNSAGILELPEANLDAVRAGITLYGLMPSGEVDMNLLALKPALGFYSTVVMIKELPEGCPVSYGGTYVTDKPTRIATIPIGYGDGYPRSLSGKGYVLIRGEKAPILGRVCMDQMMADVSHIPDASEGDTVTLIGRDGAEEISADFLGELSGRFNYELVCDLGKRIPRLYTGGL